MGAKTVGSLSMKICMGRGGGEDMAKTWSKWEVLFLLPLAVPLLILPYSQLRSHLSELKCVRSKD